MNPSSESWIDPATGQVQLAPGQLQIGPRLTREEFLASPLAQQSTDLVCNEPYRSFQLPTVALGGHRFAWALYFRGSVLQRVSLMCADPEFGTSWADWSEQSEQARKQFHDTLLDSALGPGWETARYAWGSVHSQYDSKGGASTIEVVYCPRQ